MAARRGGRAGLGGLGIWLAAAVLSIGAPAVRSQTGTGAGASGGVPLAGSATSGSLSTVTAVQTQLQAPGPSATPAQNTDPAYQGSLVEGKATAEVMPLTLDAAIARGLRTNLGLVLQSSNMRSAGGQKLQELQSLLPTITGQASIEVEQINLAAYGLGGFSQYGISPIVGPFQVVDFRAYLTQNVLNLQSIQKYLAAKHNFEASKLTAQDARDLVVMTVGNAYLLCVADQSRIQSVEAQLAASKVSLDEAAAAHEAGTSPRLDLLRAQVDYQQQQQSLISTRNSFEKDKLALARAIGLPLDQKFSVVDMEPFKALETPDPETAFGQAMKTRKDLAARAETVAADKISVKAVTDEQLPSAQVSGDFGDLGTTPAHSHGTYTATGVVSAPILQLAKTKGDREVAQAKVDQDAAQLSDAVQGVNADVRDAILDIQSAAKQVDVAQDNVALAEEALKEAQERFANGISDTLPVSQALATDAQANDQYISALYSHNVAKLALARALGVAATNYKDYVGGK